jgi:hypothetical protein
MSTNPISELILSMSAANERQHQELMRLWERVFELTRWREEQDRSDVERTAVLNWLRSPRNEGHVEQACLEAADEIERGEHRREGV